MKHRTDEGVAAADNSKNSSYWKANLKLVAILLAIWFLVAICGGILFVDHLNAFRVGKVGLGFWIAQQGSIFTFVILVLVYALLMDRLDKKYQVDK